MKALEIARKIDDRIRDYGCSGGTINLLDELIDELEELNNRSCDSCRTIHCPVRRILLENGYITSSYFYCNDWEIKENK